MSQNVIPRFHDWGKLSTSLQVVANQFAAHEPSHAYLITGSRGTGKRTFAEYLTAALFCNAEKRPCGECEACRYFENRNNPDVMSLYADDGKTIKIDALRDIVNSVGGYGFGESFRVVLIEPLEKVQPAAQNVLLKSLEEPMKNVVFIIMAHEFKAALGTIASRCIRVKMPAWSDEILTETLLQEGYPDNDIRNAVSQSSGVIGTALNYLDKKDTDSKVDDLVRRAISVTGDADCVSLSTALKDDKESAEMFLYSLEQAYHKLLLLKTNRIGIESLSDLPADWKGRIDSISVTELNMLINRIFLTRDQRASQVNWQSSVDQLLIYISEANKKWRE